MLITSSAPRGSSTQPITRGRGIILFIYYDYFDYDFCLSLIFAQTPEIAAAAAAVAGVEPVSATGEAVVAASRLVPVSLWEFPGTWSCHRARFYSY